MPRLCAVTRAGKHSGQMLLDDTCNPHRPKSPLWQYGRGGAGEVAVAPLPPNE